MIGQQLNIENKTVLVFLPENRQPETGVWYTFPNDENEARELAALLPENAALAAVIEPDWERSFTPWTAPRILEPVFTAKRDVFLPRLARLPRRFCKQ